MPEVPEEYYHYKRDTPTPEAMLEVPEYNVVAPVNSIIRIRPLTYLSRNKLCVESQYFSRDGVINGFVDPTRSRASITVGIISPSGWSP
jgi:hypothetical protein